MTAFYTFRVIFLSFFGARGCPTRSPITSTSRRPVMTVPLIVLSLLTIVAGLAVGIPSSHGTAFERFLAPVLPRHEAEHSSATAFALLVVSVVVRARGHRHRVGDVRPRRGARRSASGSPTNAIHALVLNKYYVDEIYDRALRPADLPAVRVVRERLRRPA